MSNQRKKGKRLIGVWLTPAELAKVEETAAEYCVNKSDLLKQALDVMMEHDAKKRGNKNEK